MIAVAPKPLFPFLLVRLRTKPGIAKIALKIAFPFLLVRLRTVYLYIKTLV